MDIILIKSNNNLAVQNRSYTQRMFLSASVNWK